MTKRFNNAYEALVLAYHNDHLEYSLCAACAVGNIVASANNYTIKKVCPDGYDTAEWRNGNNTVIYKWNRLFSTGIWDNKNDKEALEEIEPTGYSAQELFDLESFFMVQHEQTGDNTFETLCALIDFLLELDGEKPNKILYKKLETHELEINRKPHNL